MDRDNNSSPTRASLGPACRTAFSCFKTRKARTDTVDSPMEKQVKSHLLHPSSTIFLFRATLRYPPWPGPPSSPSPTPHPPSWWNSLPPGGQPAFWTPSLPHGSGNWPSRTPLLILSQGQLQPGIWGQGGVCQHSHSLPQWVQVLTPVHLVCRVNRSQMK